MSAPTVHPCAIVDPAAQLGTDVSIGPFSIIHGNVQIGDNSSIDSHCEIGYPSPLAYGPLIIGKRAHIRSHSVFYEGSSFGPDLVTGHRVSVREGTRVGQGLQLGTMSDIQGDCVIGNYVRTHNAVHIGKLSIIEDAVWLFPGVVLTNDPHPPSSVNLGATIRRFAVLSTGVIVLPAIDVGEGAFVGAGTVVNRNVDPHRIAFGSPMADQGPTSRIRQRGSREPAYPWVRHFTRGYPPELVDEWQSEMADYASERVTDARRNRKTQKSAIVRQRNGFGSSVIPSSY